jgi:glycosyltransferase involved in cell wall biosynthesis
VFLFGDSNVHVDLAAPSWKRLAKRAALTPLFKTLSAALVSSDANEAWYRLYGMPGERLIRFPFTVDDDVFGAAWRDRETVRSRFREAHGIPQTAHVALWCGKLTPAKRPLDLVAALELARREGGMPPWALFAGDGPLRPEVEATLDSQAVGHTITGFLNSGDVPAAFAAADFLVHTRGREPHGLVAVEAAKMGLPMVVPDTMGAAGPRSAARPGVNAMTFSAGSTADLCRAIRSLAEADADLFESMATASAVAYADLWQLFIKGVNEMVGRLQFGNAVGA